MKSLILYDTRTGATEQYAKWFSELVDAPAKTFEDAKSADLESAEKVFVLSGTYGGQIPLVKYLKSNWEILKDKKNSRNCRWHGTGR